MTQIGLRQASMGLGPVFLKDDIDAAIYKVQIAEFGHVIDYEYNLRRSALYFGGPALTVIQHGESVMAKNENDFTTKPPTIGAPSLGQIPPVTPQPVGEQVEEQHQKKPEEANDAKDQDPA